MIFPTEALIAASAAVTLVAQAGGVGPFDAKGWGNFGLAGLMILALLWILREDNKRVSDEAKAREERMAERITRLEDRESEQLTEIIEKTAAAQEESRHDWGKAIKLLTELNNNLVRWSPPCQAMQDRLSDEMMELYAEAQRPADEDKD